MLRCPAAVPTMKPITPRLLDAPAFWPKPLPSSRSRSKGRAARVSRMKGTRSLSCGLGLTWPSESRARSWPVAESAPVSDAWTFCVPLGR
jgi:hypothetical protein